MRLHPNQLLQSHFCAVCDFQRHIDYLRHNCQSNFSLEDHIDDNYQNYYDHGGQ